MEYIAEGVNYVALKGKVGGKKIVVPSYVNAEVEVITAEEQERRIQEEITRENEQQNS